MPFVKGNSYHTKFKASLEEAGFSFTSNVDCNPSVKVTNDIYYCVQQLYPINEQKNVFLKLLGESSRQQEAQLFSYTSLFNFERNFKKDREKARKLSKIVSFNQTLVDLSQLGYFPLSSGPSVDQPPLLERMAPLRRVKRVPEKVVKLIQVENLQRRVKRLKASIQSARNNLKSVRAEQVQLKAFKDKNHKLINKLSKLEEEKILLNNRVRELEDKITVTMDELISVKTQLNEKANDNQYFLKEKGSFTSKANLAFGELTVRCGIAQEKIGLTFLIICNLLGVVLDAIPSRRTVGRSLFAVSSVCCKQIQEFLEGAKNVTLMSDETRKFVHKFQTYIAAFRDKVTGKDVLLHLGVFEVPSKAAMRSFQELEFVIKGIAETVGIAASPFWEQFIISIKSLMGDKAATQISFNTILIKCRTAFLESCPNFAQLSDSLKEEVLRVNSLFCLLHVIHNLTKVLVKVLLEHEREVTGNSELKQASVEWLITEISRYFGSRASGKYHTAGDWARLGEEKGWNNFTICNLAGHRFNIFQVIASQILYNKDRLIHFIRKYAPELETEKQLASALENPLLIMHLQILASVDSVITGPLWRLSENNESILKTREYADELLIFLKRVENEPMIFFASEPPLDKFEHGKPKSSQSIALREMLDDMEPVTGASEIVPSVASALHEYFSAQFKFELGSDFSDLTELEVEGSVSTNRACEAVFGFVDYLCRKAPNMTTEKRSIITVARKNNVFDWLRSLPKETYDKIAEEASSSRNLLEAKSLEKAKSLKKEILEDMEKQALSYAVSLEKSQARLDKIKKDAEIFGFWKTEEEMENSLSSLKKTAKIQAVKANLRYRRLVVQINCSQDSLFKFSSNGNNFNLETLKLNLVQLMGL